MNMKASLPEALPAPLLCPGIAFSFLLLLFQWGFQERTKLLKV
jgi:hypothetical protein